MMHNMGTISAENGHDLFFGKRPFEHEWILSRLVIATSCKRPFDTFQRVQKTGLGSGSVKAAERENTVIFSLRCL